MPYTSELTDINVHFSEEREEMRAIEEILQEGRLGMVADLLGMQDFDDQAFQFLVHDPDFRAAVREAAQRAFNRWDGNVAAIVVHVSECRWCRERVPHDSALDLEAQVRSWRRVGPFRNIVQFTCAKSRAVIVGKKENHPRKNRARAKQ